MSARERALTHPALEIGFERSEILDDLCGPGLRPGRWLDRRTEVATEHVDDLLRELERALWPRSTGD